MSANPRAAKHTFLNVQLAFAQSATFRAARHRGGLVTLSLSALAWIAFATTNRTEGLADLCVAISSNWVRLDSVPKPYLPYMHACLMVIAMMLPLTIPYLTNCKSVRVPGRYRFFPLIFPIVYMIIWMTASVVLEFLFSRSVFHDQRFELILLIGFFAAAWQTTPSRLQAVLKCSKAFVPDKSVKSNDTFLLTPSQSVIYGVSCLKTCLPLMALSTISGHALLPMVILSILIWNERANPGKFLRSNTLILVALTLLIAFLSLG